ncbi:ATP-binding protein [Streptomyces thermodiastaticus]|uniref:ATP-binding protein n=1 Tax=Streptomyces thermodiastaticus TaxID=44061 RepID=UPI0016750AE9|nr:ATP-binding protein [Streptomyces thermodiastaticus]MCE7549697.1 ATP-binding protein [Streptomyces thermodiastaticus]GHF56094.1 ATPase [Streptomyces thermodiastaticus]
MTEQRRNTPAAEPPSGAGGPEWCAGACKPAEARRAVAHAVAACCRAGRPCGEHAVLDAQLVASELTTNAILHGGGVTEFQVELVGCEVRVCVSDRSDRLPVARPAADHDGRSRLGGRGWPIVCRLARDVEVLDLPSGGKRISAVVPLS